jgi:hypothetical protein
MIGLDGVIGVLLHDVACAQQQLVEHPRVGGCSVGGYFAGVWKRAVGAARRLVCAEPPRSTNPALISIPDRRNHG